MCPAIFAESSQFRFWMLSSQEKVKEKRQLVELELLGCTEQANRLSLKDIETLHLFYEQRIIQLCKRFQFPFQVHSTAVIFYKRFFLVSSLKKYDPKLVMIMCIFLAMKSENVHLTLDDLLKQIKNIEPKDILNLELDLLQALRFHLHVLHPWECFLGLHLDCQRNYVTDKGQLEKLAAWAQKFIERALLSDLCFWVSPAQIAMAAFLMAGTKCNITAVQRYYNDVVLSDHASSHQAELKRVISAIQEVIESVSPKIDTSLVKEIDRKLYFCKSSNAGSAPSLSETSSPVMN